MMLRIETALETDAACVAAIIREAFTKQVEVLGLSESEHPRYVGFETESRVVQRMAAGVRVVLAYRGNESVGTVSWAPDADGSGAGDIMRLAVAPQYRRCGYGQELMAHAETQLTKAGATLAQLSIVAQFTRLQLYYEQLGYSVTDIRRVPALPFDLAFMQKPLGDWQ